MTSLFFLIFFKEMKCNRHSNNVREDTNALKGSVQHCFVPFMFSLRKFKSSRSWMEAYAQIDFSWTFASWASYGGHIALVTTSLFRPYCEYAGVLIMVDFFVVQAERSMDDRRRYIFPSLLGFGYTAKELPRCARMRVRCCCWALQQPDNVCSNICADLTGVT